MVGSAPVRFPPALLAGISGAGEATPQKSFLCALWTFSVPLWLLEATGDGQGLPKIPEHGAMLA